MNNQNIVWDDFVIQESLSTQQLEKFKRYFQLLHEWNAKFNITTITGQEVLLHHFQDSLALRKFIDLSAIHTICDVGSGGGFPGIPLAICMPTLKVILIEVTQKKILFLREVVVQLGLTNIEFYTRDWGTFVNTSAQPVDVFVARASLAPRELMLMYESKNSVYRKSKLVYWASVLWQPDAYVASHIKKEYKYTIADRERRLVLIS